MHKFVHCRPTITQKWCSVVVIVSRFREMLDLVDAENYGHPSVKK